MKSAIKILTACATLILSLHGYTLALDLGRNITIPDGTYSGTNWYGDHEDNEVEPNNVANQSWDLEGFFLSGTTLTLVGGYDFLNGNDRQKSGDIFIDVDVDAIHGSSATGLDNLTKDGYQIIKNSYGYDYVLDMDFTTETYSVYQIDSDTQLESVFYRQNDGSNAWLYTQDGEEILSGIAFSYLTGLTDSDVDGLTGNFHNAVSVDLGFLSHGTAFTSHFTMGCGNDNLMGQAVLAPEPATLALFGIGLICLAGIGRKKLQRK
jgi:hypothetical protein